MRFVTIDASPASRSATPTRSIPSATCCSAADRRPCAIAKMPATSTQYWTKGRRLSKQSSTRKRRKRKPDCTKERRRRVQLPVPDRAAGESDRYRAQGLVWRKRSRQQSERPQAPRPTAPRFGPALRRAPGRTPARESTAPEEGAPCRCDSSARAIARSARGDEGGGAPEASRAHAPRARTGARTPVPKNSQSARSAQRLSSPPTRAGYRRERRGTPLLRYTRGL